MSNAPSRPPVIAVLAFDGISPFHLSVPCLVFGESGGASASPDFHVRVCGMEGGPLRTSAGFTLQPECGLRGLSRADIVVIPTWHADCRPAPPAVLAALRAARRRGALVVGLCLGAFVLAEAGLLDGLSASTHWHYAAMLAQRYPKVKVDSEVLYVDEGDVLTSAGVAAGLDCCLHLMRRLRGAEAANRTARRLVIAPHRQGGQAQFIEQPLPAAGEGDRLAGVLEWASRHLDQQHSIDSLATRAAMSRRSFTRHFRQNTGTTVKQWLLNQRLAHAQRLLETSDMAIERIAQHAGFGSALSLRQHFRTTLRLAPSAYREQFGRMKPA
ncbi:MAG TPA: helix-turn-helix domain-containing protein [Noviherbaspirillum sp.]|jgi:transcriptional regulator GlxA family with amidase domain|uniref:GlxA family transcriptional regulator n=1 Tax=Noviherbaspirillum sp. TaxID=1926288 RepID=UPI002F93F51E